MKDKLYQRRTPIYLSAPQDCTTRASRSWCSLPWDHPTNPPAIVLQPPHLRRSRSARDADTPHTGSEGRKTAHRPLPPGQLRVAAPFRAFQLHFKHSPG
jgi:hypothetical protein